MVNTATPNEVNSIKPQVIYRKKPATTNQLGRATAYTSFGESFVISSEPGYNKLVAWDYARRKEPSIKRGLELIVLALLDKIGYYSHPDSEIDDFVQLNIIHNLSKWIKEIANTALYSGSATAEINYKYKVFNNKDTKVWIDDLVGYHPLQVKIVLDDYGKLNDGVKVWNSQYKSGIWVPIPASDIDKQQSTNVKDVVGSLVRLPKWKRLRVVLTNGSNPIHGESILESVLPYHLYKEAFRDMMMVALDRYGTPLIYAIVPPLNSNQSVEEPDGSVRPLTMQELTEQAFQDLSSEAALVFTQISKDQPVQLGTLTTGNNFSDSFIQAINFCDDNIISGLGIPSMLIKGERSNLGTGKASETQYELFDNFIESLFNLIVVPFVEQVIGQLIAFNFDPSTNPLAIYPGTISKKPTRTAELKVISEMADSFTKLGYLDPYNEVDFNFIRQLINAPQRPFTKSKFVSETIKSKESSESSNNIKITDNNPKDNNLANK